MTKNSVISGPKCQLTQSYASKLTIYEIFFGTANLVPIRKSRIRLKALMRREHQNPCLCTVKL